MQLIPDDRYLGQEPDDRFPINKTGKQIRPAPGGLIAHRNDAESLANAIITMIRDPELQKKCAAWNRQRAVEQHGWSASAEKLRETYRSTVDGATVDGGREETVDLRL